MDFHQIMISDEAIFLICIIKMLISLRKQLIKNKCLRLFERFLVFQNELERLMIDIKKLEED
jgi:hypothetical protein